MIDGFEIFKILITVFVAPFSVYVVKQLIQLKEDRFNLQEELSNFKIFCAERYAKNEAIDHFRKEMKEEFSDIKAEIRSSLERIENKVDKRVRP